MSRFLVEAGTKVVENEAVGFQVHTIERNKKSGWTAEQVGTGYCQNLTEKGEKMPFAAIDLRI